MDDQLETIRRAIRTTLEQQSLMVCISNDGHTDELAGKDLESVVDFLAQNIVKQLRGEPLSVFG